jgi:putative ABC transport system ATP-binding protein
LSDTIISLRDVALTLRSNAGPVDILKGIDLDVAQGETLGLVGPSGSGKSTLLMVIAGLEAVSGGSVAVAGQDFANLDEDDLARFRSTEVGIVFQSFHLIPTMTALENVAVPLELRGDVVAAEKAREELQRVGLDHRIHHYPGQLSGGEQQRVAIARALAAGARLILADEPTGNLDQENGAHIIELLFDLRASRDATLVLVTHEPALAERCDRVARLQDGNIVSIDARNSDSAPKPELAAAEGR